MIPIHFVADGPRDAATVPHLVSRILGVEVEPKATDWKDLRVGGYPKKVLFAILQAIDAGACGLVAVVDRDKADRLDRLRALHEGRELHRRKYAPFPTACGEAVPHGDAWLLDDPVAVRQALGLAVEVVVLSFRKAKSPKEEIDSLISQSERCGDMSKMEVLAEIALRVDHGRFAHSNETGFRAFLAEVRQEFRGLGAGPEA
jgi:hypothetical protein